ncbi:hypothetical protein BIU99_02305 [Plantibacter sp. MMLR14_011]|nr:hypothetical protein BIU99_02305 [Plantibacter sp. MMLR14_011]
MLRSDFGLVSGHCTIVIDTDDDVPAIFERHHCYQVLDMLDLMLRIREVDGRLEVQSFLLGTKLKKLTKLLHVDSAVDERIP